MKQSSLSSTLTESRYQKKNKGRESNRICRENEKSSRESQNSIKKSTREDLVFKERLVKKLIDKYVRLYVMEEVISENIVKLKLPVSITIHLVVNMNKVVRYRELMKGQRVGESKPVKVDRVEE